MILKFTPLIIACFLFASASSSFGQGTVSPPPNGSSSSPPSSTSSTPSAPAAAASPSPGTFSIEAEIFGYKSLQSDSEAIACDIAAFLYPGQTVSATPYGKNKLLTPPDWTDEDERRYKPLPNACRFKDGNKPQKSGDGVIILSSTTNALANYQIWRLNMTLMQVYLNQAKILGCPAQVKPTEEQSQGNNQQNFDFAGGVTVAGQVIAAVQSALQLFASSESSSEVTGTIQDQALMDGIARQLRNMNVPVLIPDVYTSYSLAGWDYAKSPFLSQLVELITERNCLQTKLPDPTAEVTRTADLTAQRDAYMKVWAEAVEKQIDPKNTDAQRRTLENETTELWRKIEALNDKLEDPKRPRSQSAINSIQSLTSSIDTFVATLLGASPPSTASNAPASSNSPAPSPSSNASATATASSTPPASSAPPIVSALAADGLSRGLHQKVGEVAMHDSDWQILAVKALESGGALITTTNIFGSKVHFGGGAVATYALFSFEGNLACSGNVFDYGGYVRASHFADEFRRAEIEPNKQLIFLRGGCAPPATVGAAAPLK
jgi:hypothetical protein